MHPRLDAWPIPIRLHLALGWALVIATLGLIAFHVPPAVKDIGESYLIFFFHFPSAVNCLLFFVIAGGISLYHLARSTPGSDQWAASAVEVGVLGCTVTLVTGSIWAKAAWSIWWDATDPRLMTVAIMWLTYVGYLALRSTIDEPTRRARFSAAFGVIAAVNVPLVYFAIQWFGVAHHPMNVDLAAREMVLTRWFGAGAFFVLYTALWRLRRGVHAAAYEVGRIEEGLARAGI
ncbi:MAG: cytochrome c biogenesis protein CcsA [Planctomycetes bacterium]|nr:cytochrome c biogenesis protein CcsA [Planctomycetota bacterium]